MGALDCVTGEKIKGTDSTEVFTINMATSNSYLDVPVSLVIIIYLFRIHYKKKTKKVTP